MKIIKEPAEAVNHSEFLDLLCFRYQKHALLGIRDMLGDKVFIDIIEKFAGTYLRFPTASAAVGAVNELHLAVLYKDLKKKAKVSGNVAQWNDAETRFMRIAGKLGYKYERAVRRAKAVLLELDRAKDWMGHIRQWENRRREDIEHADD